MTCSTPAVRNVEFSETCKQHQRTIRKLPLFESLFWVLFFRAFDIYVFDIFWYADILRFLNLTPKDLIQIYIRI